MSSATTDCMDGIKDAQPTIEAKEDANESAKMDIEDELSTNQIQAGMKVNSIATIEALCLKPSSLSHMPVLLYKMDAMAIVRPTMSSDLASLKNNFVCGY